VKIELKNLVTFLVLNEQAIFEYGKLKSVIDCNNNNMTSIKRLAPNFLNTFKRYCACYVIE